MYDLPDILFGDDEDHGPELPVRLPTEIADFAFLLVVLRWPLFS